MKDYLRIFLIFTGFMGLVACGGGGGGGGSDPAPPPPSGGKITISGKATYDNVPHNTTTNGLDFAATTESPIRGATVEAVQGGSVVATDVTDANGDYSVEVNDNTATIIRVKAETVMTGSPSWDISVVDNTNSKALYSMESSPTASGTNDITLDVNAGSGWGGSGYTGARVAAPFHILDRSYDVVQKIIGVDSDANVPELVLNWSVNNVPTSGDQTIGQIGTTFYQAGEIFVLGAENTDTDEFDGHVLIHEAGHYFEDKFSRSDSLGGPHSTSERLDMRVAFGEGFGNAWSGMITDDPIYRDSLGASQASGFAINVETNAVTNPGWFSEGSVQSILYDLYDSADDGADHVSLGLKPLYDVFTGPQVTTPAFTSIFTFISYLKDANAGDAASIDVIVNAQDINSTAIDIYATNETNDAGAPDPADVLPVYTELLLAGAKQTVCSVDDYGTWNKLSNIRYVRFDIPVAGSYTVRATQISPISADPDIRIFKDGVVVGLTDDGDDSGDGEIENATGNFEVGEHVAEVYEFNNFVGQLINSPPPPRDACFDVEIIAN